MWFVCCGLSQALHFTLALHLNRNYFSAYGTGPNTVNPYAYLGVTQGLGAALRELSA